MLNLQELELLAECCFGLLAQPTTDKHARRHFPVSIAVIQLSNYCALLLDDFADGGGKSVNVSQNARTGDGSSRRW